MHAPWKECYGKPDNVLKSRDIILLTKVCMVKTMIFPVSHVQMWELDHKQGWASKNWCFQTVVLEKILESPSDSKEIKPLNPKGNQPWIFTGTTDAEAETPILRPPHVKNWFIGKHPDAGKDWGQTEKGMKEKDGCIASLTLSWVWANSWTWTWVWANSGR